MRIVCWQTILMNYHTLFFSKIRKDVAKFVVYYSRDWRFKEALIANAVDDRFCVFSNYYYYYYFFFFFGGGGGGGHV